MATVEIKRHAGRKMLPGGKSIPVDFGQDYVILNEVWYDAKGIEHRDRITAGYCDVTPGASFRPIVSDLSESLMAQIMTALAERDAKSTGKTVDEMMARHSCKPPPALGDSDRLQLNSTETEEYEDDDFDIAEANGWNASDGGVRGA